MSSRDNWDGTRNLRYVHDDGGRALAGYAGKAGDCVTRSIAIVGRMPYEEVYQMLASGTGKQRASRRTAKRAASAREGINTQRKWFKDYMTLRGFVWTPTMGIGTGCSVHLLDGELPMGRLVVAVSKHYTAVIDGVIHDTHDPTRAVIYTDAGVQRMTHRCVYGYWTLNEEDDV